MDCPPILKFSIDFLLRCNERAPTYHSYTLQIGTSHCVAIWFTHTKGGSYNTAAQWLLVTRPFLHYCVQQWTPGRSLGTKLHKYKVLSLWYHTLYAPLLVLGSARFNISPPYNLNLRYSAIECPWAFFTTHGLRTYTAMSDEQKLGLMEKKLAVGSQKTMSPLSTKTLEKSYKNHLISSESLIARPYSNYQLSTSPK